MEEGGLAGVNTTDCAGLRAVFGVVKEGIEEVAGVMGVSGAVGVVLGVVGVIGDTDSDEGGMENFGG